MKEFEKCERCGTNLQPRWSVEKEIDNLGYITGRTRVVCKNFYCEFCEEVFHIDTDIYSTEWKI